MISQQAIIRGYNRGKYTTGAPTCPEWVTETPYAGTHSWQRDPVRISERVLDTLRQIADELITDSSEVIAGTRDWWAATMIAETSYEPATPVATIVKVSSVAQIQAVMRCASQHKIPVTVSAGRSNVTGAALPLQGGIVLDLCQLNHFISFDKHSQIVEVEAGMFGDVFEQTLQRNYGMTMGHWPSSYGISTVGGWVACRGAGQLSTRYGKIEDMVYGMDVVLADGRLITVGGYARSATGPDLQHVFIGSEGTLGVIVRLRLKVQRLPDYSRALAFGFVDFAAGLDACREILQRGATPAALRLYDQLESRIQFNITDAHVLLIADEGAPELVDAVMKICADVCCTARPLDSEAIYERWLDTRYLTGKSAEGFKHSTGFVADTLEMFGCWRDLSVIYHEVIAAINLIPGTLAGSAHQSHAYTAGACLYFSLRGEVCACDRRNWYRSVWDAANAVLD